MWHDLKTVANNRFLNDETFTAFALDNVNKFSVVSEQVSTWHVNALVEAYREDGHTERLTPLKKG